MAPRALAGSLGLTLVVASLLPAQAPGPKPPEEPKHAEKPQEKATPPEGPIVKRQSIMLGGKPLAYDVTTGTMPIRNEQGETEAHIFFVAYTRADAGDRAKRPLMFSFNGGPGSASVWLHLGAVGPMRVDFPDAVIPAPPFHLVDNQETWLDRTDLVFIDPVGTGYSRATKPELTKKFHGLQGDLQSVGEFIRMYLTRYDRWTSPLFLVGESYGTTRAAGLAGRLVERNGIAFNGIILVSTVLNFQTLTFDPGNDTPYPIFLPTYTATAWSHKKLAPDLQRDLKSTLEAAEKWAATDYTTALARGDGLTPEERRAAVATLAKFTGLDPGYVDLADLRIEPGRFRKELLRKDRRSVGRLDSRYVGVDASGISERPDFDPSMAAIRPPYTSTINAYVRDTLGYKTDVPYYILGEGVGAWDWGLAGRPGFPQGYPETATSLRDALAQNPSMKVLIASGYYDLATPFAATEYTFAHMGLAPTLRKNLRFEEYEAGHMMYVHPASLSKLKRDVSAFIDAAQAH
jgi:carboxypeptidase C (cathepsin A)